MATAATERKRSDLLFLIDKLLRAHCEVEGVVAVGSVGTGHAQITSDIDAIIFMDPIDHFIVPAESIWCPWDDSFHSIFIQDEKIQADGIHLDAMLRDLGQWSDRSFIWPEYDRAGLADGWVAFDRSSKVAKLIESRTCYDNDTRISRLDEFILSVDNEIEQNDLERNWERYGPFVCFGRLDAVWDSIIAGLFAYNRRWRFHRDRESDFVCRLNWLPANFQERIMDAVYGVSVNQDGYLRRAQRLQEISAEIITALKEEGLYGDDPASEAFIRSHADPGRAWNMAEWNQHRKS
jgi:hypothetical protein